MTEDTYRFAVEQKVIHHLMLHAFSLDDSGLLTGKLGVAVTFYLLGRKTGVDAYTQVADRLLDRMLSRIDDRLPWGFSAGLCGIGWGMDFLLYHGFVKGDPLEVCEEIDRAVMRLNVRRIADYGLEKGWEGLLHYVLAHMACCRKYGLPEPFDTEFVADLRAALRLIPPGSLSRPGEALREQWRLSGETQTIGYDFPLRQFTGPVGVKEKEIGKFPLGIKSGLAGFLIKRLCL